MDSKIMAEQKFSWLNEPPSHKASDTEKRADGYCIKSVKAISSPGTDFWRIPPNVHRDTGHFYYTTVKGDFHLSCVFRGKWITQYDQAGIMCRTSDEKWIKTGIEFDEDKTFAR
jgi:regulation of enolase protein 1 (concanavalin A-like superfamily)